MSEICVPVDAAAELIAFLSKRMAWPIAGASRPGRMVQVLTTGGNPRDYVGAVDVHQLTITAWGEDGSDRDAPRSMARLALGVIRDAEFLGRLENAVCLAAEIVSTPYDDPDPTTGRARATFTCRLHLRGQRKEY